MSKRDNKKKDGKAVDKPKKNEEEEKTETEEPSDLSDYDSKEKEKNQTKMKVSISSKKKKEKDYAEAESDVEGSNVRYRDSDEEQEENEPGERKSQNENKEDADDKKSKTYQTCEICQNQKISKSNKSHTKGHEKSTFIKDMMKQFFGKSNDENMIFCIKCKDENRISTATFNQTQPIRHLFEHHVKDFKENEKEILRQIDFFSSVIKNKHKQFEIVVGEFVFSHDELKQLANVYFAGSQKAKIEKALVMGKLYSRLAKLLEQKGIEFKIPKKVQSLIDDYRKENPEEETVEDTPVEKDKKSKKKKKDKIITEQKEASPTKEISSQKSNNNKRPPRDLSEEPLEKKVKPDANSRGLMSSKSPDELLNLFKKKYAESKLNQELLEEELKERKTYKKQLKKEIEELRQNLAKAMKKL